MPVGVFLGVSRTAGDGTPRAVHEHSVGERMPAGETTCECVDGRRSRGVISLTRHAVEPSTVRAWAARGRIRTPSRPSV
jgi:hypothetical protein